MVIRIQRGEKQAMEELLVQFRPLIRRLASCLDTEDTSQDLGLFLLYTAMCLRTETLRSAQDPVLVAYFKRALFRCYIRLAQQERDYQNRTVLVLDMPEPVRPRIEAISATVDQYFEDDPLLVKGFLTEREYLVLRRVILLGETVARVAADLRVSRQTINKTKLRALQKIKDATDWRG
ncbi:sigma-70 family RNA polymerase sigma factor [Anaerotruncus rubiinfantis]|uniref:sigma-70 family RNA polymerase sigma factor n=1 Tax=Anaerotruncus rubiinfantis TaxID=1720200 RepID=UPI0012ABC1BA|nr:sigma-70 family RNA polymerase sigma factor [Anaerotruncus rubiinfantis]